MDAALKAISDGRRRRILQLLGEGELTAGEIVDRFDLTWPAISQHLRVLSEAGLITDRREGTRRYYRLSESGIRDLRSSLDDFWSDQLARLKAASEARARRRHRGRA